MSTQTPLVIYHADCNDGLTAAWAVQRHYRTHGVQVDLYAAKYQQPPPDVKGRQVILVDFSYKRPVLLEMAEKAESILVLDHHKSAEEDLRGVHEAASNVSVVFDMERSGAGIAWDHFLGSHLNGCTDTPDGSLECVCDAEPRPWFVNHVEHNDLWRHSNPKYEGILPECKAVMEYIRSYPASGHFEMYDTWMARSSEELPLGVLVEGDAILRAKSVLVQQAMTFAQQVNYPGVGPLLVCNVPFFLSSEVGHALAERNKELFGTPAGITYYHTKDGKVSLSFRSIGDYDVSALAIVHGGGGHRNAAGAAVDHMPWVEGAAYIEGHRVSAL